MTPARRHASDWYNEARIYKITRVSGPPAQPVEHPFEYGDVFVRETLTDGTARLRVGLRRGQSTVLRVLGGALSPPYRLLYVLHTSRNGAALGRYESPDLDAGDVERFLEHFGHFIAADARHDVWLHSMSDQGTIVVDRYNMVYVYGPLNRAAQLLADGGIQEVAPWAAPEVPYPHALHYHEELDGLEQAVLQAYEWRRTPLPPGDVQFWTGPQAS